MFRKLLLTALLAAAAGVTMTASTTQAAPPSTSGSKENDPRLNYVRFEVFYFTHRHWERYGTYPILAEAERAAEHLRHEGYEVRIDRF
jgi:hypothetical protein